MKKLLVVILGLMIAASAPADARTVKVVASFTVLADMAKQIGGVHVEVHSLVGPNGDPHVYEPTPADGQTLAGADIVLVSGLGLEGWMDRLIRASGTRAPVVVASQGIVTRHMVDDGKEITDPHAWNSAANGVIYARNITDALASADPADAADIRANGARYVKQLQELDAWVRSEVKTMPLSKRKIITSHDAFGYMGAAYNIRFLAPEGFSTESEPSARDVAALIDQIRKEKIKVVYIENSNDPRLVQQLASATGARIGGKLYPEALSEPDGPAPTYTRMFRYNVETLLHGMQGH
ncbi:MAG TPA: metal ABC transporter substrate-binding protein [Paraburkholderia sp.]|uniref:metal ABC transporter substrate-binding protein n=1 Tax=Paraburkholderia sp. TaxID=1926495 RepID=UPI002C4476BD|nr:metal ABC transporter substrate-binding protein [Paraburkholderia sp.]HTR11239.1 metal ABC transporter substrate-binding protein [Paraburkholderia sp.]